MADFNSTTSNGEERNSLRIDAVTHHERSEFLSNTDILFNEMAEVMGAFDIQALDEDSSLRLANCCEENIAGLCCGLAFMGKTLNSFAANNIVTFSPESLCQAGHFLTAVSKIIPTLSKLQQRADSQFVSLTED